MFTPSDVIRTRHLDVISSNDVGEMTRAKLLHNLITRCVGLLPKEINATERHCLLDLACGWGHWVLEMAAVSPHAEVVGIDHSQEIIAFATARAHSQHYSNALFGVKDLTHPLGFPEVVNWLKPEPDLRGNISTSA